jgi:hypothetical protein
LKRIGECNRCGACCETVGFFADYNQENIEWLQARAITHEVMARGAVPVIRVLLPHICPQLQTLPDGQKACALEGDSKPVNCRNHPAEPLCVLAGCGYSFEEEA